MVAVTQEAYRRWRDSIGDPGDPQAAEKQPGRPAGGGEAAVVCLKAYRRRDSSGKPEARRQRRPCGPGGLQVEVRQQRQIGRPAGGGGEAMVDQRPTGGKAAQ